ncbi:MAG: type VII toxin-antitoxin system HepT family RNase toxin [Nitrososphaerales archaeon]
MAKGLKVKPMVAVEIIKEVISRFNDVNLAYLFGSYAEDKAMPISDIDIAILTDQQKTIPHLTAEISKALRVPEEKLSVLNLENSSPTLTLRILKRGVRILDRGGYEERLKEKIPMEVVEVLENEKASFQTWLHGNPIDEAILKRIIVQLSEDVNDLYEVISKKNPEDLRHDKNLRKAFERNLHTSIEGAIDLLRHITSSLNLGIAEYYRDYVEISRNKGLITKETAERILELIPTRHILIHRYREIDYSKLWADAKKITEIWPKLQQEIKEYLRKANVF